MTPTLTVQDLLLEGEPLEGAEVLAGQEGLSNAVSWVVSLRPYPPAFPRLRGGEIALVAAEHLARLDPPTTLAEVVRYLSSREIAALAVRGLVDMQAINAARAGAMPLLRLPSDAPLHDIEQAIMRECALYQARREMQPVDGASNWIEELLLGRVTSFAEAQALAKQQGYSLPQTCQVAYLTEREDREPSQALDKIQAELRRAQTATYIMEGGLAVLLPPGAEGKLAHAAQANGLACGIGSSKPLLEARLSLAEAQQAAIASALLRDGRPAYYDQLGADRLLVLLYQEHPEELARFIESTLGPILRHDEHSSMSLLPTLKAFIENGGHLRETAAKIYIHRNTLAYRLERAAEILVIDLANPGTRFALELALRALPMISGKENPAS